MDNFLNLFEYPNKTLYKTILKMINFKLKDYNINFINFMLYIHNDNYSINNHFLSNNHKLFLKNYFYFVTNKLYIIFKVIYKWKSFIKNKYSNNIANNKCLYLEDISIHNSIKVYQLKKTYLFSLNDIVKLFDSLYKTNYEYPQPINIKNPYLNIYFSKPMLYDIYYQIKNDINEYPHIKLFYESNFDIDLFLLNNYNYLLDISLKKYFIRMDIQEKVNIFLEFMVYYNNNINYRHFIKMNNENYILDHFNEEIYLFKYITILLEKTNNVDYILKKEIELNKKSKDIYNNYNNYFFIKYKNN